MPERTLVFLRDTGATTLVLLLLSTLTLLSAVTFSAETAVVIGATTLPTSEPAREPAPAKAGEAISRATDVVTIYFMCILLLLSDKPFARPRYCRLRNLTCNR